MKNIDRPYKNACIKKTNNNSMTINKLRNAKILFENNFNAKQRTMSD